MQTSNCSHRPALGEVATLTHHSKPELTLKTTNWTPNKLDFGNPGPTRIVSYPRRQIVVGAGVYHPSSGNSYLVEPAGTTNTVARAESAAEAATCKHDHIHSATGSSTLLHQIRKQLLYPEKHHHHVQVDILKILF